jgi:hypothetical protein
VWWPRSVASINMPRFRAVTRLGVTTDRGCPLLGAAHPHIALPAKPNEKSVSFASQKSIASGRAPIMAVATNGDVGVWPVLTGGAHQASQMTAYLPP